MNNLLIYSAGCFNSCKGENNGGNGNGNGNGVHKGGNPGGINPDGGNPPGGWNSGTTTGTGLGRKPVTGIKRN